MMKNDPRQRLAAVMGKCFPTVTPKTRDELRHAALCERFGRNVESSADLTDDEVRCLLELWEHWQSPFLPSDKAIQQVNELARVYQQKRGQQEMRFD